ncbi:PPE family protein [Mycobacterium sp. M1]|uniref:PPE family protein n=1 Tax=Mycolicibacter acidiphilus TaxID=2835306 RepID=A0ABS5RJL8_9MYCO|nr:PPE family protein [Mycolicibacter acidiphilus]MBS9534497.1 PPE family protein [Mycolicibacter acidiphilus]
MLLDYGLLPPEVNSGRLHSGPGPGPLLTAAGAWRTLASDLDIAAAGYRAALTDLAAGSWAGPAAAQMTAAVLPYASWLTAAAASAEQTVAAIEAAVGAYEAAHAGVIHPVAVDVNRGRVVALARTNVVGQNTPAIAAAEMEYTAMWAQDAVAMYTYAASAGGLQIPTIPALPHQLATAALPVGPQSAHGSGSTAATELLSPGALLKTVLTMTRPALPIATQIARTLSLAAAGRPKPATGRTAVRAKGTGDALTALSRLSGSGPATTASLGRAGTIGRLSVPLTWGGISSTPAIPATPAGAVAAVAGSPVGAPMLGMLGHPQHGGAQPRRADRAAPRATDALSVV